MTDHETNKRLIGWINAFTEDCHYAPSLREVAATLDVTISTAKKRLDRLRSAGLVDWNDGEARTLRVTEAGLKVNARI